MRKISIVLALAAVAAALAAPAYANLVKNGGFELTTNGNGQLGYNTTATGWSVPDPNQGLSYTFLYALGTADTSGANGQYGNVGIWGPNNGSANGLPAASPDGGNFIGSDPSFQPGSISQMIDGLTAGDKYTLSFYWAGAQQYGFDGPTTEGWQVSFGSEMQSTNIVGILDRGFSGWMRQTFTFTADGSSDLLSFLALGGPSGGQPPFALLDGVSLNAVPEPGTLALFGAGLLGFIGFAAWRRRGIS